MVRECGKGISINANSSIRYLLPLKNFVYKVLNPLTIRLLASTGITEIVFAIKSDLNQTKSDLNQTKSDHSISLDNLLNFIYATKSDYDFMIDMFLRFIFHSNIPTHRKFEIDSPTGELLPYGSKLVIDKGAGILAFPKYDKVMSDYITHHGIWEPSEQFWIRKNVSPGVTVLNVGANVGVHSIVASKCVGDDGRVVAFECHPEIFLLLGLNLAANGVSNTKAINIAIDEFAGSGRLYCSDSNSGDNRLVNSSELGARFYDITKIRLETFCEAENLSPEIVIMDIQGSELSAIRGLGDKLNAGGKILFEFTPSWIDPNIDVAKGQLQEILLLGYQLRILADNGNDTPITVEDVMSMFSANSDLLYLNLVLWKR